MIRRSDGRPYVVYPIVSVEKECDHDRPYCSVVRLGFFEGRAVEMRRLANGRDDGDDVKTKKWSGVLREWHIVVTRVVRF